MFAVENILLSIKIKFIALVILNITDVLATLILVNIGFCVEANIFMQNIIQAPLISIAVKTFIPAVLLYFLYHRLKLANEKQIKIAAGIINAGLGLYILINISHVVWLIMYFVS